MYERNLAAHDAFGIAIAVADVRVVVIIDIVVVGKQRRVNPLGAAVGDRHVGKAVRIGQYLRASRHDAAVCV